MPTPHGSNTLPPCKPLTAATLPPYLLSPVVEDFKKQTLLREQRKILGTTVAQARAIAEDGAGKALNALAVATSNWLATVSMRP